MHKCAFTALCLLLICCTFYAHVRVLHSVEIICGKTTHEADLAPRFVDFATSSGVAYIKRMSQHRSGKMFPVDCIHDCEIYDLADIHCMFHRHSSELCYCFPPSVSSHQSWEILGSRYVERTTPIFEPIRRAVFAPASVMQSWRNPQNTNKQRKKFPFPCKYTKSIPPASNLAKSNIKSIIKVLPERTATIEGPLPASKLIKNVKSVLRWGQKNVTITAWNTPT